jgi:predicted small integral membrane protein
VRIMEHKSVVLVNRLGQTCLTFTLGLYFLLVSINNIFDYDTNFRFVQHVLSMDSLPYDKNVMWHAITNPKVHHLAYCSIISWEFLAGALCVAGGLSMVKELKSDKFSVSKKIALTGLWIGVFLWVLAFITIGGEWFMMWESATWNGELSAFRMFAINSILILLFYLPE